MSSVVFVVLAILACDYSWQDVHPALELGPSLLTNPRTARSTKIDRVVELLRDDVVDVAYGKKQGHCESDWLVDIGPDEVSNVCM